MTKIIENCFCDICRAPIATEDKRMPAVSNDIGAILYIMYYNDKGAPYLADICSECLSSINDAIERRKSK